MWKRKPEGERTYQELWECFKRYLGDVRENQRLDKLLRQANVQSKPKLTAVKEEGSAHDKKKKKKKNKKDTNNTQGVDNDDGPAQDNKASALAATEGKGGGKGKKKSKTLCLSYQTKWKPGPGCKFGDNCRFTHDMCGSREEYNALVKKVAELKADSSSSSSPGSPRNTQKGQPVPKEITEYKLKFCRFGGDCKFKDSCT